MTRLRISPRARWSPLHYQWTWGTRRWPPKFIGWLTEQVGSFGEGSQPLKHCSNRSLWASEVGLKQYGRCLRLRVVLGVDLYVVVGTFLGAFPSTGPQLQRYTRYRNYDESLVGCPVEGLELRTVISSVRTSRGINKHTANDTKITKKD